MLRSRRPRIPRKTPAQLALLRIAGSTTAEILERVIERVQAGVSTLELDEFAEACCRRAGVEPAFKGLYGCPASLLVSVNEEVVHGLPRAERLLEPGDVVSLDFGVIYQGWYGDHARTVTVGPASPDDQQLIDTTREALLAGIEAAQPEASFSAIGRAVEAVVHAQGFGVVEDFVGHGIGRKLHEEPQIPNRYDPTLTTKIHPGFVFCIEPMVSLGSPKTTLLKDDWTAVTKDGSRSAHFEHMVAVTSDGPELLSVPGFGVAFD